MAAKEHRTVTLFDRPPVRIRDEEWPEIASSIHVDGNQRFIMVVRENADGEKLVYGVVSGSRRHEKSARGGFLLSPQGNPAEAILQTAKRLSFPQIAADKCISRLPAEEI